MPKVLLNNISTYYQVGGTGDHSFLLFNGAGCTTRTWDELMPFLQKLGRIIRFDARGLGQTDPVHSPYSLKTLADDGLALLDYLRIQSAIIIGHAFGGRVAQIFIRDNPARTRALVLCGTGGLYPPRIMPPAQPPATLSERIENLLTTYYGPRFRDKHPERAQKIIADYTAQFQATRNLPGTTRQSLLQLEPAEEYWGKVPSGLPVLLIYGTEDRFGHEKNYRDLVQRIPGARLELIDGAGHMAIQEEPEIVVKAISNFLVEKHL